MASRLKAAARQIASLGTAPIDQDDLTPLIERTPEEIRERRRAEAIRARYRAIIVTMLTISVGTGAYVANIQWLQVGVVALSGLLGFATERAFSRQEDEDQLQQDVVALTAIYYQSPSTIRDMLRSDFLDRAIENLLNAALGDEQMGSAFWRQSVAPFIHKKGTGYKSDWRYQIDLVDLEAAVELEVDGVECRFEPQLHRRLHTTVTYEQTMARPPELFYIAVVFDGASLPAWFERENFWLREVTNLPTGIADVLRAREPNPDALPREWGEVPHEARIEQMSDAARGVARTLLDTTVWLRDRRLDPSILYLDGEGVSWGFRMDEDAQHDMRSGTEVHVELATFVPRAMQFFPVNINAPTKHPSVQFSYARTSIPPGGVNTEVFYSAQRPYDVRLRSEYRDGKRIVVRTEADDWVFRGSGCIFHWDNPEGPAPG